MHFNIIRHSWIGALRAPFCPSFVVSQETALFSQTLKNVTVGKKRDRQTDKQTDGKTDRQTDFLLLKKLMDKKNLMDKQTEKQMD